MAVYVIVLLVVVLLLVAAYRSLGGSTPSVVDTPALLTAVRVQLASSVDGLSKWLMEGHNAEGDVARTERRANAGAQQILDRLPPAGELDDPYSAARVLLGAAAEDTGWAWRMLQAQPTSPGLTAAVVALRDHAAECCREAERLLGSPALGEPGDRR